MSYDGKIVVKKKDLSMKTIVSPLFTINIPSLTENISNEQQKKIF